jgi:uncharacterized protein YfaS (alpha-2-macroglobulin family)
MKLLFSMAASIPALVFAAPAHAESFSAVIDCGGVYAPGDDVPFDVTITELDGQPDDPVFVAITLDIPDDYNDHLVANGAVKLSPGEVRTFRRTMHLPVKAPAGAYTMRLNASSEGGFDVTSCDFTVE